MTEGSVYSNVTRRYVSLPFQLDQIFIEICVSLNHYLFEVKEYIVDTLEHFILGLLIYTAICLILYLCIVLFGCLGFNKDVRHARRVLFVIAHPDDEVMFFGPTIVHYAHKPDCTVFLLCLSSGKNYGMDKVRTNELYESCKILGIKEENIFVHNHTDLPDAMDVRWPIEIIAKNVLYITEAYNITNIVTFDRHGISGHENHCSIYYGVASLIWNRELPKVCGVYILETVNVIRKYWLFLDIPISLLTSRFRYMEGFRQRFRLYKAMQKHKSQLVWFRRLYLIFSRYLFINTLIQLNLVDLELDELEIYD